jgi:hypothetical protein
MDVATLRYDVLARKAEDIEQTLDQLGSGGRLLGKVGGAVGSRWLEVAFQQNRLALVRWLQRAPVADVVLAYAQESSVLGEGQRFKYRPDIPAELVLLVSRVELYELALGTHPALKG